MFAANNFIRKMKKILVVGAGKSATILIRYLLEKSLEEGWWVTVADLDPRLAEQKCAGHPNAKAMAFSLNNEVARQQLVQDHDVMVSMLPPAMHITLAKDCLRFGKSMVTASYVSDEMAALDEEAKAKGILLLNEMGVDPGIDHMTAMETLDDLRSKGYKIIGFESFAGGLMAPESEGGPWKYKFTWNPKNVVMAGSAGPARFLHHGKLKNIPYTQLFRRTDHLEIPGWGAFEAYGNRDSLKYQTLYKLEGVHTLYRGTLRRPGFCSAWHLFVQMGLTDDAHPLTCTSNLTHAAFLQTFLPEMPGKTLQEIVSHTFGLPKDAPELDKIAALDLFSEIPLGLEGSYTPADILLSILQKHWTLSPGDMDLLVMLHQFEYENQGEVHKLQSHLCLTGKNEMDTAMALTVGLPAAIGACLILQGKIQLTGVHIPVLPEIYEPVLLELRQQGVFMDTYKIL
jgi:saccharopine dehydrogenase-like NADP-dependent oxidoreductase